MGLWDWLMRLLGGGSAIRWQPPQGPPAKPLRRRQKSLGNLDASQFAPISRTELMVRGMLRGVSLLGNVWFGRRDLIPPTSDPRTLLIDRGMVTQGLITPEELAHIHEVGAEMDEARSVVDAATRQAREAAQATVAQAQAEREARKRKKQQEAADRNRRHAEDVARRKATDIIFLGRGVSRGLADRRANVEKLQELQLPLLATPADVATALGVTIPRLRWLAFHAEAATRTHYVRFRVPKRSGGTRELAAPHRDLRRCQRWILDNILSKVPLHPAAHGFVPGRSTLTNAAGHVGRDVVVNTDLKDFFPSITFPRVKGLFGRLGYSPAAATILALLCTESPRRTVEYAGKVYHVATGPRALPQGASTSPALSNLVAWRLDRRLSCLAEKLGWTYTRYADDATFSASAEAAGKVGYLLARIRHITADEGFTVNEAKTRVLRASAAQTVTGIVVNRRPGVPRKQVRRLRAILHRARREGLAAQNRQKHPHFAAWVHGMVAYISMVNPDQGQALRRALAALAD